MKNSYCMGYDEFYNKLLSNIYDHVFDDREFEISHINTHFEKIITQTISQVSLILNQMNDQTDVDDVFEIKFQSESIAEFKFNDLPQYITINMKVPKALQVFMTPEIKNRQVSLLKNLKYCLDQV